MIRWLGRSPVLLLGLCLFALGAGPLLLAAALHPDEGPSLHSVLAGCTFVPSVVLILGGVLDMLFRVVPQERRRRLLARRRERGLCIECGSERPDPGGPCPRCGAPPDSDTSGR